MTNEKPGDWAISDGWGRHIVVRGHTEQAARRYANENREDDCTLIRLAVDGRTWYPAEGPYARPDLMPETTAIVPLDLDVVRRDLDNCDLGDGAAAGGIAEALLAEVVWLRAEAAGMDPRLAEAVAAVSGLDIPAWANPIVKFEVACHRCGAQHTDEDGNRYLYPPEVLTEAAKFSGFGDCWYVDDTGATCQPCWEVTWCEECGQPIHAWEQAAVFDNDRCTAHPACLPEEEQAKAKVMSAPEAARVLHEAWVKRNAAGDAKAEQAGGESRG